MLKSKDKNLRRSVAQGLSQARLANPGPNCDALLEALHDSSDEVRIATMRALGHFRDSRAIAPIRELILHPPRPITDRDRYYYIEAVSAIGGPEGIALLNDMMQLGFRNEFGFEKALVRLGSPSSARAVWAAYLKDPIRKNTSFGDINSIGYRTGMSVLAACADADLLKEIQERMNTSNDRYEKAALGEVVSQIKTRLNK